MYTSAFTSICPNGKLDEQYAHDVTDSFATEAGHSERFLYCRRCGQAAPVRDAFETTARSVSGDREADAA